MPLFGSLDTVPLPTLIRWLNEEQKSGVLEVEKNRRSKAIEFRKGFIGSCMSNDPAERIGQVLLSRGKISKEQLQQALATQATEHKNLGLILIEMGCLTQAEISHYIAAKAKETILGLFAWSDATFRFHEGATLDCHAIEVTLSTDEVLSHGLRHRGELAGIQQAFRSSGVVLRRTSRAQPNDIEGAAPAHRIFDAIDGTKTIAELVLHAHAPQFLVLRFLFRLIKDGFVEIVDEKPVSADFLTLLDPPAPALESDPAAYRPFQAERYSDPAHEHDSDPNAGAAESDEGSELEIEVALRLIARGDHGLALELLEATYRANPGDNTLKRLIARAESAFMRSVGSTLSPTKVPVLTRPIEVACRENIGSREAFVLGLVDGRSDIKSLVWVSPLRDVELFRTLQQLLDKGLIALEDRRTAQSPAMAGTRQDDR